RGLIGVVLVLAEPDVETIVVGDLQREVAGGWHREPAGEGRLEGVRPTRAADALLLVLRREELAVALRVAEDVAVVLGLIIDRVEVLLLEEERRGAGGVELASAARVRVPVRRGG